MKPDYMPGYRLHAAAARCGQFDGSDALQQLRDAIVYIPPPEKPRMKSLRGNPLTAFGWSAVAALTFLAIAIVWVIL